MIFGSKCGDTAPDRVRQVVHQRGVFIVRENLVGGVRLVAEPVNHDAVGIAPRRENVVEHVPQFRSNDGARRAQRRHRRELQRVRVLICGKGPLQTELEKFVKDNKLKSFVKFMGFVDEDSKPDYLASADIAVFPSTGGESFGIVLIEAMAAGSKVVLAGNNVGYASVMGGHKDQLIKPQNTKAFAKTLKHFMDNFRARRHANIWQTEHVAQYDVRRVGQQLIDSYREILNKRAN